MLTITNLKTEHNFSVRSDKFNAMGFCTHKYHIVCSCQPVCAALRFVLVGYVSLVLSVLCQLDNLIPGPSNTA
jgi:hypothetical protein